MQLLSKWLDNIVYMFKGDDVIIWWRHNTKIQVFRENA